MKKDPICGMDVDETTPWKVGQGEGTQFFCSGQCRETFLKRKKTKPKQETGT